MNGTRPTDRPREASTGSTAPQDVRPVPATVAALTEPTALPGAMFFPVVRVLDLRGGGQ